MTDEKTYGLIRTPPHFNQPAEQMQYLYDLFGDPLLVSYEVKEGNHDGKPCLTILGTPKNLPYLVDTLDEMKVEYIKLKTRLKVFLTSTELKTTVKKGTLGQSKTYTVKFMKRDPTNPHSFIDL